MAVYPDTYQGHAMRDKECSDAGMRIPHAFCDEFKELEESGSNVIQAHGNFCANANPYGVREHNVCYRCPAGYRVWVRDEESATSLTS